MVDLASNAETLGRLDSLQASSLLILICPEVVCQKIRAWFDGSARNIEFFTDAASDLASVGVTHSPASTIFVLALDDNLFIMKRTKPNGGCIRCLQLRRMGFRSPAEIIAIARGYTIDTLPLVWLTPFVKDVFVAMLDLIENNESAWLSVGWQLGLRDLKITPFVLEQDSSCTVCREVIPKPFQDNPVRLQSRMKQRVDSYRICNVEDLGIDVSRFVNPVCGMLGSAYYSNRLDAYHAQTSGAFLDPAVLGVPVTWTGHKTSFDSSLMVGILEGLERHSGLYPRDVPTVTARFSEVRDHALDPRHCGLYEDHTYEEKKGIVRFDEDLLLQWVWGYSLTEERSMLVASQMAFYGHSDIVIGNSNGCATGSCLEEAIFYALMELVERDAFLLHWYAKMIPPKINPKTMHDKKIKFILERIRVAGYEVHLLDSRLDLPVPTVMAVLLRNDNELGAFSLASGASFNPQEAIESALSEVTTHIHRFEDRARAAQRKKLLHALDDYTLITKMADHSLFYAYPEAAHLASFLTQGNVHSYDDAYAGWIEARPNSRDLKRDIEYCISFLQAAGMPQVIIVDQSSPEQLRLGVRTVRAIVPGLMPLDFGYGCCRAIHLERTYAVPLKFGKRQEPMGPEHLYRVPHPFS